FPELIAFIRIAALSRQPRVFFAVAGPSYIQVDKAVVVVIGKGNADRVAWQLEIAENGDILELLALDILINMAAQNDVFPAISVQVGNGDGFRLIFCGSGQPDLGGHVTKFPARQALVESAPVDVDNEDVQNAVSVEIEEI